MPVVHTLVSSLLSSNTWVIDANPDCDIIVDPGDPDITELIAHLKSRDKKDLIVILTHEHADHCAGLNALYHFKKFKLICSQEVADNIADKKRNLSMYFQFTDSFEVILPVTIMEDGESICLNDFDFTFIKTPGHSPGSTCIFFNHSVFSGDTLLNNTKTPLNLPHSNKQHYSQSLEKLKNYIQPGMTIYPGHGESFVWESANDSDGSPLN